MSLLRRTRALAVSISGALAALPLASSAVVAQSAAPAVPRDGWFHVIWRDAQTPTPMRSEYYVLVDDAGTWWDLELDPRLVGQPGGPLALDRRRVSISAERLTPGAALAIGHQTPRLRVRSIGAQRRSGDPRAFLGADAGATVTGSRPYVTILCAFADAATVLPATKERMEQVMGPVFPGMDHYYREMSENVASLAGSVVVGWYTLPQPRAYYIASGGANLNALSQDCTAAADADVHFPSFTGINLQFNQRLDCCSWGGSRVLTRDGVTRVYPMTWMADWAIGHSVYGHEIGHSFGWPHSHGAYGAQYDSKWDVMSNANNFRDPVFGWMAVHTIGFHKDRAGWIPPARKFIAPAAGCTTIVLERGAIPGSGGHLLAEIPIPGSSSHYTVEARRFAGGYDTRIPAEAVIIHRTNGFEAEVVDVDLNSNPNDAAAQWLPGETFVDSAARIAVAVVAQLGDAFQVTISTGIDILAIALAPASARDSAVAGSTATIDDSAAVTIAGSSAGTTAWSATKRGAWVTLTSSSGTGSGMLRWRRDPAGLAPGIYVDTITVSVVGAAVGTARLVDTLRILGAPSPLVLSLGVGSRRDSIMAHSTRLMRDSVALSFTGTGSASAAWTATSRGSWLTLGNASGVGDGHLRWTRDPSGLAAGTYVDTIAISASGAIGSPTRVVDTLRVLPLPSVDAAAEELLGTPRLTSFERQYLDQEGNGDAAYNLGDFLAFLDRRGLDLSQDLKARFMAARRRDQ